ncbi:MAG: hemolysin family protein [Candidatus Hydrothermarchaeales archaeon]
MTSIWIWAQLVGLFVLLLLSGFFSGSETALISLNKIRIRKLMEEGVKNAFIIDKLLGHPDKLLATILVGNNLVNIAAAAIATSLAITFFGNTGIGIATGVMTLLVLIFGEITPKGFATENAEKISLKVARPIDWLVRIFYPVVEVLTLVTNFFIEALGGESKKIGPFVTEEEIRMLVDVGEEEGVIEKDEAEMIEGVFEFGDTTVKEVMSPRIDMECIESDAELNDAISLVIETGHSRIPVFEESVDNIVGIVYSKDLLGYLKRGETKTKVRDVMRDAYFIPETKKLDDLLREFQKKKVQIAMAVGEYGGTAGLVTLEDLLEEIVGEIVDEHDMEAALIRIIEDRIAIVDAKASIDEVNDVLGLKLPEDEFESVGGLIFSELERIPAEGEKIIIDDVTIVVEKMEGNRISKVKIVKGDS